jgi:hypothetical protein
VILDLIRQFESVREEKYDVRCIIPGNVVADPANSRSAGNSSSDREVNIAVA